MKKSAAGFPVAPLYKSQLFGICFLSPKGEINHTIHAFFEKSNKKTKKTGLPPCRTPAAARFSPCKCSTLVRCDPAISGGPGPPAANLTQDQPAWRFLLFLNASGPFCPAFPTAFRRAFLSFATHNCHISNRDRCIHLLFYPGNEDKKMVGMMRVELKKMRRNEV